MSNNKTSKSQLKVWCSPLSSEIYAGKISKHGFCIGDKHNVTDTAVGAVAHHLIQRNERLQFAYKGKLYYLSVTEANNPTTTP
jgi:hypothetical protein